MISICASGKQFIYYLIDHNYSVMMKSTTEVPYSGLALIDTFIGPNSYMDRNFML